MRYVRSRQIVVLRREWLNQVFRRRRLSIFRVVIVLLSREEEVALVTKLYLQLLPYEHRRVTERPIYLRNVGLPIPPAYVEEVVLVGHHILCPKFHDLLPGSPVRILGDLLGLRLVASEPRLSRSPRCRFRRGHRPSRLLLSVIHGIASATATHKRVGRAHFGAVYEHDVLQDPYGLRARFSDPP